MLTNHKKEQFMNRSGSFSTHGSKRGYSDLGLPMEYNDLLPPEEKRKIIMDRFNFLNSIERPSKRIREDKHNLQCMLMGIRAEVKKHNIESSEMFEKRMNFGAYFINYCRENMPKDYYQKLVNEARKNFDELN